MHTTLRTRLTTHTELSLRSIYYCRVYGVVLSVLIVCYPSYTRDSSVSPAAKTAKTPDAVRVRRVITRIRRAKLNANLPGVIPGSMVSRQLLLISTLCAATAPPVTTPPYLV